MLILFASMSFAGMLGGPDEENKKENKKQKKPAKLYRNEGAILDGQINQANASSLP